MHSLVLDQRLINVAFAYYVRKVCSSCTPHTDPLNTVQRKRSRADRAVATEKRAKQRLADVNLSDQQRLADEVRN